MALNMDDFIKAMFEDKMITTTPDEEQEDHIASGSTVPEEEPENLVKTRVAMPEEHCLITPSMRFLAKRQEIANMEKSLATQKEEFRMKMESLQKCREDHASKENELQETSRKFDKFIKQNESKRSRAIKRASVEREARTEKKKELGRLCGEVASLEDKQVRLQRKLSKLSVYKDFLSDVTNASSMFQDIKEVTARYDTLMKMQNALAQKNADNKELMRQEQLRLHQYIGDNNDDILRCNKEVVELQAQLYTARSETTEWELTWVDVQKRAAQKSLILARMKLATSNMYQLIRQYTTNQTKIAVEDMEQQMDKIEIFIQDMNEIVNDICPAEVEAPAAVPSRMLP
uniref:coiled-coil domain-containing protein 42 homolog n=1 Tax=Myxine glutinosa TaxID=7769 RepID=UPI00358EFE51